MLTDAESIPASREAEAVFLFSSNVNDLQALSPQTKINPNKMIEVIVFTSDYDQHHKHIESSIYIPVQLFFGPITSPNLGVSLNEDLRKATIQLTKTDIHKNTHSSKTGSLFKYLSAADSNHSSWVAQNSPKYAASSSFHQHHYPMPLSCKVQIKWKLLQASGRISCKCLGRVECLVVLQSQ